MVKLIGVLGSVTPPGRLFRALEWSLETAYDFIPQPETQLIDLANYRIGFADGRPLDQMEDDSPAVVRLIAAADAVIFASPVYRASFTGALKNLLDLVPAEALAGKPCGLVAMGATMHHYLGVDWQLRAVLSWFGAVVPPSSVYLSSADFHEGQPNESARSDLAELIRSVLSMERTLKGLELGPAPLALKSGAPRTTPPSGSATG